MTASDFEDVRLGRYFFFQAEDGIRYYKVTGVQTCALPICERLEDIADLGDVPDTAPGERFGGQVRDVVFPEPHAPPRDAQDPDERLEQRAQIGRASCRE